MTADDTTIRSSAPLLPGAWHLEEQAAFGPTDHPLIAADIDGDAIVDHLLYGNILQPYVGPKEQEWIGQNLSGSRLRWTPLPGDDLQRVRARLDEARLGSIRQGTIAEGNIVGAFLSGGTEGTIFVGVLALVSNLSPIIVPLVSAAMAPGILHECIAICFGERDANQIAHFFGMGAGAGAAGGLTRTGHSTVGRASHALSTRTQEIGGAFRDYAHEVGANIRRGPPRDPRTGRYVAEAGFTINPLAHLSRAGNWLARHNPFAGHSNRARAWISRAQRHARAGQPVRAANDFIHAAEHFERAGLPQQQAEALKHAGDQSMFAGRSHQAIGEYAEAELIYRDEHMLEIADRIAFERAEVLFNTGHLHDAAALMKKVAHSAAIHNDPSTARAFAKLGEILTQLQQQSKAAKQAYKNAANVGRARAARLESEGDVLKAADTLSEAGRCEALADEPASAADLLGQAIDKYAGLGHLFKTANARFRRAKLLTELRKMPTQEKASTSALRKPREAALEFESAAIDFDRLAATHHAQGDLLKEAEAYRHVSTSSEHAADLFANLLALEQPQHAVTSPSSRGLTEAGKLPPRATEITDDFLHRVVDMNRGRAITAEERALELFVTLDKTNDVIASHHNLIRLYRKNTRNGQPHPSAAVYAERLALFLEKEGRLSDAVEAYEQLAKLRGNDQTISDEVADALQRAAQLCRTISNGMRGRHPAEAAVWALREGELKLNAELRDEAFTSFDHAAHLYAKHGFTEEAIGVLQRKRDILRGSTARRSKLRIIDISLDLADLHARQRRWRTAATEYIAARNTAQDIGRGRLAKKASRHAEKMLRKHIDEQLAQNRLETVISVRRDLADLLLTRSEPKQAYAEFIRNGELLLRRAMTDRAIKEFAHARRRMKADRQTRLEKKLGRREEMAMRQHIDELESRNKIEAAFEARIGLAKRVHRQGARSDAAREYHLTAALARRLGRHDDAAHFDHRAGQLFASAKMVRPAIEALEAAAQDSSAPRDDVRLVEIYRQLGDLSRQRRFQKRASRRFFALAAEAAWRLADMALHRGLKDAASRHAEAGALFEAAGDLAAARTAIARATALARDRNLLPEAERYEHTLDRLIRRSGIARRRKTIHTKREELIDSEQRYLETTIAPQQTALLPKIHPETIEIFTGEFDEIPETGKKE